MMFNIGPNRMFDVVPNRMTNDTFLPAEHLSDAASLLYNLPTFAKLRRRDELDACVIHIVIPDVLLRLVWTAYSVHARLIITSFELVENSTLSSRNT
jgi:hypothetical protein